MCLLVILNRVVEDAPVVVGANREELYARGGEPPRIMDGPLRVLCGTDPASLGTWLGVNHQGVLAAVTNRAKTSISGQPRSRGLLVRDLLGCPTAAEACQLACRELASGRYAGCNILVADCQRADIIHAGDWLRVRPLTPGVFVLTNRDVNTAGGDPRLAHALGWLENRPYANAGQCLTALKELCAQKGNGQPPMCLHGAERGTVSSTLVVLRRSLERSLFLHAQGPPDRTPFDDYSPLLHQMAPKPRTADS